MGIYICNLCIGNIASGAFDCKLENGLKIKNSMENFYWGNVRKFFSQKICKNDFGRKKFHGKFRPSNAPELENC